MMSGRSISCAKRERAPCASQLLMGIGDVELAMKISCSRRWQTRKDGSPALAVFVWLSMLTAAITWSQRALPYHDV